MLRPILPEPATVTAMALRTVAAPRRFLTALAIAGVLPLLTAAPAGAVLAPSPCGTGVLRCATLDVPLDHSGAVAGTVGLNVRRLPAVATGAPTTQAVVALAGGPGQAAVPLTGSFAEALAPLLTDRDLIVFDQRGTGASGPLECTGLLDGPVARCAEHLGPARGSYRTVDSAADIEDLRVAGGYDKLVLYGVSYGTKVALTYAALHPDRVAALVLDSVVPLSGQDALSRQSFGALRRVLGALCANGACRHITASPNADLARLAARLRRHPLRGRIVDPGGGRQSVTLTRYGLWQILLGGDLNPSLRADLPGAMRAALRGDSAPVLRLRARAAGLTGTAQAGDDGVNEVLFTTTRCEETIFPWDRAAAPATRARQAEAAADAVPAAAFKPFDAGFALDASIMSLCVGWPVASPAPADLPALPQVPTLVLAGQADLRTPVEQARAAVAGIGQARIVTVPETGHSTLGSDLGHCASDALAAFAAGQAPPACGTPDTTFRPAPIPPRSLRSVRGATRVARTLNAVDATIADVKRQIVGDAIASGGAVTEGSRTGGLRSGVAIYTSGLITLRKVVYVPGVVVSGFVALRQDAGTTRLLVRGSAAARGSLAIDAAGHLTGELGGHRVGSGARAAGAARGLGLPRFAFPELRAP